MEENHSPLDNHIQFPNGVRNVIMESHSYLVSSFAVDSFAPDSNMLRNSRRQ